MAPRRHGCEIEMRVDNPSRLPAVSNRSSRVCEHSGERDLREASPATTHLASRQEVARPTLTATRPPGLGYEQLARN